MPSNHQNNILLRLTALWALAESGLGGWMHALKLPFTGVFVGGFAVVVISLIAHYSDNSFRQIWKATVLVLLVKFAVSPQSPFQAYIAVGFQGLMGAVLYSLISSRMPASLLFGIIAMLESAVQKLIFMTIIFGKTLWDALDSFFMAIAKDFALPGNTGFSFWVIGLYVGIYLIWGLVLGLWINRLPERIQAHSSAIRTYPLATSGDLAVPARRKRKKWLGFAGVLLFIITTFAVEGLGASGVAARSLYLLLRTVAVLLLLFYVLNPLVQWLMQRWLSKSSGRRKQEIKAVMDMLPELRLGIKPAYAIAREQHKGVRRYPAFVYILIILSLKLHNEQT